ncbi:MAG: hypothetical protein NW224_07605 [Leptolyngbyaceae cyanobacterium bins.302]|nr:hypothetical protein [Leptolyngbyaceae cyanobacterium bins.302]
MENKLCSNDVGKIEAIEQSLWEALVRSEGMSFSGKPGEELTENSFQVEENPEAQVAYPWNPTSSESEAFFNNSAPSIFDGWQDEEIVSRSRAFFSAVDNVWSTVSLQASLVERFAARMPQNWLATIAHHAQKVVAEAQQALADQSTVLADQLVQCAREVAPGLAEEDFYVLARPLAAQFRNGGTTNVVNSTIAQVPQLEWEQLSDLQRARLGLAIARYAIDELQSTSNA